MNNKKTITVILSRVYWYDTESLDGDTIKEKAIDAKRKTYLDFEEDWILLSPTEDDFSAKVMIDFG